MGRSRKYGEIIAGTCQECGQHARLIVSEIAPGYCQQCYKQMYKKSWYIKRQRDPLKKRWTAAEDQLVRQHFHGTSPAALEALLPGRTWIGIQRHAYALGRSRIPADTLLDSGDTCRPKAYWQSWCDSTASDPIHPAMAELLRFLRRVRGGLNNCAA